MKLRLLCFTIITMLSTFSLHAGILHPGDVFTGTPEGSWRYSELLNSGHGSSTTFFPTQRSQFDSAVFQGFVTYDPAQINGWTGTGFDSIQVFSTFVQSDIDQTISVRFGGDDGHSLWIDETFIGGGGFGVPVFHELNLAANVSAKVELVGYNGPGNWAFGFGERNAQGDIFRVIDDVPGVQLKANGNFTVVPEPASLIVMLVGVFPIVLMVVRGRKKVLRWGPPRAA